jgi:hypothetical protein
MGRTSPAESRVASNLGKKVILQNLNEQYCTINQEQVQNTSHFQKNNFFR